jgi:hypothetical protein
MPLRKLSPGAKRKLFHQRCIDNLPKTQRPRCGAKTRSGQPCKAQALTSGRCRLHGGLSTGPRTKGGKQCQRAAASAYMQQKWEEWKSQPGGRQLSEEARNALSAGQKRRRMIEGLLRDRSGRRVALDEGVEHQPDWKLTKKQLAKWGICIEHDVRRNKLFMLIPTRSEQHRKKIQNTVPRIIESVDETPSIHATSQLISGIAARACVSVTGYEGGKCRNSQENWSNPAEHG